MGILKLVILSLNPLGYLGQWYCIVLTALYGFRVIFFIFLQCAEFIDQR